MRYGLAASCACSAACRLAVEATVDAVPPPTTAGADAVDRGAADALRAAAADAAAAAELPADELRGAARDRSGEADVRRLDRRSPATVSERSPVIWLHGRHLDDQAARREHGAARSRSTVTPQARTSSRSARRRRSSRRVDARARLHRRDRCREHDRRCSSRRSAKQTYVYTQFEAIYARRVFPCFDEPDIKVPWKLTLDVPKAARRGRNTPIVSETPLDGEHDARRVRGDASRCRRYLVAFGVGPFDIVDAGKTQAAARRCAIVDARGARRRGRVRGEDHARASSSSLED